MDRCLIDLMLEQVDRGNKIGETFTEQAWADIAESFNAKFRLQTDMFMLENRYILMMKERDDINNILNLGGFAWDEENQIIVAEDEYWEAYIKVRLTNTTLGFVICVVAFFLFFNYAR